MSCFQHLCKLCNRIFFLEFEGCPISKPISKVISSWQYPRLYPMNCTPIFTSLSSYYGWFHSPNYQYTNITASHQMYNIIIYYHSISRYYIPIVSWPLLIGIYSYNITIFYQVGYRMFQIFLDPIPIVSHQIQILPHLIIDIVMFQIFFR